MKIKRTSFQKARFILIILIFTGTHIFPIPVKAALTIISVSPNSVTNQSDTLLTITGTDFIDGAVVSLQNGAALSTTFVNSTTLNAQLPAGTPVGIYSIVVTNPDSTQAILPNSLTIFVPSPTLTQTATPTPTPTLPPTSSSFERPLIVVQSYRINPEAASPQGNLDVIVVIYNAGQRSARNIVISFTPGDLLPMSTGGIIAIGEVAPGDKIEIKQPFTATWDIFGLPATAVDMTANYQDGAGETYTEKFSLTIPVVQPKIIPRSPTPTPTSTPTATVPPLKRAQIVITHYLSNVAPLQPGVQFELELQVQNVGNDIAKNVTLIVGGGSPGTSSGTAEPGGTSGAGGEFTNFAPLGSSNIQALGEIQPGAMKTIRQSLIVNVNTNPGAYPMRISFAYQNERGVSLADEQVITLLVYSLPNVEISFYRDPGPLFAGQPNLLPIQIVNLGRKTTVLGNMRLTANEGELSNNSVLIGTLEAGGYFTLDATWIPVQPGEINLQVSVDYIDDFNQPQKITRSIPISVQEMALPDEQLPNGNGEIIPIEQSPEPFFQKLWRIFLGFIGLDSARPISVQIGGEFEIQQSEGITAPAPPLKGP